MEYLLVGDIGGTKTALSLYAYEARGGFREVAFSRYVSGEYSGLAPLVRDFLRTARGEEGPFADLRACVFGVAGPVESGICRTTNLPWVIDQTVLAEGLGAKVALINDFHAVALGIGELTAEDLVVLQEGDVDPEGPIAIVGAGTGLGEAIVLPTPTGPRVVASEGGHVDFAPRTPLEVDLLRFLWKRHRRVSVERVVSGPGLHALYDFVIDSGQAPESPELRAQLEGADAGRIIGEHGVHGTDAASLRAVDMFVSLYGSEAGNLALKVLPRGGLYVAGGIAPKLIDKIRDGSFMHAFLDKGRLSSALERLQVAVVMNPQVALLGARRLAAQLAAHVTALPR
jgi:glucokinase